MSLFSRKALRKAPVLSTTPDELAAIGRRAYGGESPHPPGISLSSLDGYVLAALEAAGQPATGSTQFDQMYEQLLEELLSIADVGGDWAVVGGFCSAMNFAPGGDPHPKYLELIDRALIVLRNDGVAYPAIPPFALDRYTEIHGWHGANPRGWPSALDTVDVPRIEDRPGADELQPGESRKMTEDGPDDTRSRTIYAERSESGNVVAVIDGVDLSDQLRKRWVWMGLEAPSYSEFLRELGERLVTPTWWAHDDLKPYFPCHPRSRQQMRGLVREHHGPDR